jgi:hypothetical protein
MRAHQPVREQVQAQVRVCCINRGGVEIDDGARHSLVDAAVLVVAHELCQLIAGWVVGQRSAERRRRVPGVEDRPTGICGDEAESPGRPGWALRHAWQPSCTVSAT